MEKQLFIQNDGLYLDHENGNAWFVDRNNNILHKLNLEDMELHYECNLNIDEVKPYRRTPLCYEKDQTVVLFPDNGSKILFYDEKQNMIEECVIETEYDVRIGVYCFGIFKDLLWAVSYGMKQIFLVDVKLKRIIRRYTLFGNDDHIEIGYESILNGENIFCVSRNSNYVSETNIVNGEEKIYELPIKEIGFNTIYYDGEKFWLSSMSGNIYIWDRRNNIMEQVYSQNGTRYRSIRVGNVICFLPFNLSDNLCDELLCFKMKEKECFSFAICGQEREGIYVFEYVMDDLTIGISHSEDDFITEINIESGARNKIYFNVSEQYLKEMKMEDIKRYMHKDTVLYENEECDISFYLGFIQAGGKNV